MSETAMLYDVVAVNIKTGAERVLVTDTTERNAEAIIKMAVMRRGVDEEFYTRRSK
jgi:trimethylamine:corrinoid methyltransferase-like protein